MVAINTSKKITTAATPVTAVKTPITTTVKSVTAPPVKPASAVSQAVQGVKAAMTPTTTATPVKAPVTAASAGAQGVTGVKNASTLAPNLNTQQNNYFSNQFGGTNKYVADQLARYQGAVASGDTGLQQRLQADAKRVGYQLPQQGQTPGTAEPGAVDTGTTGTAAQLTPEDRQRGYTSVNGKIKIINPDGSLRDVLNQEDNNYVSQLIQADANRQNELNTLNAGQLQNQQTYDYATGKLVGQKAVDTQGAQELQNRRGGFYSGGLDYQLGGINSAYAEQFGQLAQDYQARNQQLQAAYGNNLSTINQTINALIQSEPGRIQSAIDTAAAKKRDQRLEEAKTTGIYYNPDAEPLYNELLGLKQQAEAPGITSSARAALSRRADTLRAQLQGMGVDISQLGAGSTSNQSNIAGYGIRTEERRQADVAQANNERNYEYDKNQDTIANGWKTAEATGKIPADLAKVIGVPAGTTTEQAKQDRLEQLWQVAEATGTIPNELADLYGFPRGTRTMDAINNDRDYELDRDASDLAWIKEDYDQSTGSGGGGSEKTVSGTTAGSLLKKSLTKIIGYTADEYGNKTIPKYGTSSDWETRKKAFIDALNTTGIELGAEVITMLTKAGYTTSEIAKLQADPDTAAAF